MKKKWSDQHDMNECQINKNKNKTAEEYRAEAQRYAEDLRRAWKQFWKTGVFVVATAFVLVLLALAWFVNNTRVHGNFSGIMVKDMPFEIGAIGSDGVHDDLFRWLGDLSLQYDIDSPNITGSGKVSTNWLLSDQSHMMNQGREDWTTTSKERKDYAIEPGSYGDLSFFIVPENDGKQTIRLQLSVRPFSANMDSEGRTVILAQELGESDETFARQMLNRHILFYLRAQSSDAQSGGQAGNGSQSSVQMSWIRDGHFEIELGDDTKTGERYTFTIHWNWPQTFGQMVLKDGDSFLNGKHPVLTPELREELVDDLKKNPGHYFYNSLTRGPLNNVDIQKIDQIISESNGEGLTGDVLPYFADLSSFYNQADQIIGSNISFIAVELTAEPGGTTE